MRSECKAEKCERKGAINVESKAYAVVISIEATSAKWCDFRRLRRIYSLETPLPVGSVCVNVKRLFSPWAKLLDSENSSRIIKTPTSTRRRSPCQPGRNEGRCAFHSRVSGRQTNFLERGRRQHAVDRRALAASPSHRESTEALGEIIWSSSRACFAHPELILFMERSKLRVTRREPLLSTFVKYPFGVVSGSQRQRKPRQ